MTTQELLVGEVGIIADYIEMLASRRAGGEMTSLYGEVRDAAHTIMCLRADAPGYVQPDLDALASRCTSLLRSIAH